ncbi:MAG: hypothetical protein NWF04_07365 [Candidatus Bathyarchaeota archaeon]|nr:hypothetical protein [Candidatus Bathyarchaeota archaeon]
MQLKTRQLRQFLLVAEGVGAVFMGLFLAAYWLGIPTNVVYHSDPVLRLALQGLGGLLLVLVLAGLVLFLIAHKNA